MGAERLQHIKDRRTRMNKVINLDDYCTRCHKLIDPNDDHASDENENRLCLDCFFDHGDVEIIAEVSVDE